MSSPYCVIIPAFDAAETIGGLVRAVRAQRFDVVVVDDGSRDATARVASEQGAVVISHLRNVGKGLALRAGFRYALQHGYRGVVTLDSDGQHDPAVLGRFIDAAERLQARLVIGNRMQEQRAMPMARRWTNAVMSQIISLLTRQDVPDSQCGFRFIHAELLQQAPLGAQRFDIETELVFEAVRQGWTVVSVPIPTIYRNHRSHIQPIRDGLRFLGVVLKQLVRR